MLRENSQTARPLVSVWVPGDSLVARRVAGTLRLPLNQDAAVRFRLLAKTAPGGRQRIAAARTRSVRQRLSCAFVALALGACGAKASYEYFDVYGDTWQELRERSQTRTRV